MKTLKPLLAALVCAAFCVSMGTVAAQEPATTPDHPSPAAANPSDNDADGAEKTQDEPDREVSKRHAHGKHHGGDDVIALGRNAHLPAGQHADSVVAILGSATSEGDVADSVVAVLGNVRVTGSVQNGVVAIMGGMYIDGRVDGDVIGVAGNVELGPQAHITGDLVVIGGELTRDPASTVDGDVRSILTGFLPHFEWLQTWIHRCLLYGRPLAFAPGLGWAWGLALGFLALYALLALVFADAVERCVHTLETQPGPSIIAALVTLFLFPVALVLLLITVLGIAAIPFVAAALLCGALFGKVVVLASIGRKLTELVGAKQVVPIAVAVVVGSVVVLLLYTVPVVGLILHNLLGVFGLGVVVYTLLTAVRTARQARVNGPGPAIAAASSYGTASSTWSHGSSVSGAAGATAAGPENAAGSVGAGAAPSQAGAVPGGVEMGTAAGATETTATRGAGASGDAGTPDASGASAGAANASGAAGFGATHGGAMGGAGGVGPGAGASMGGAGMGGAGMGGAGMGGAGMGGAGMGGAGMAGGGGVGGGGVGGGPPGAAGVGGPAHAVNAALLPRAGFWIRMGALLLDVILVSIVMHAFWQFDLSLLVLASYGAVMWKLKSATVGGIICGLKVARLDGREIDWPTAIVRALSCFLSLAVVGLGFIWIAIDHEKQGWHDKIAGTVVVRAPKGSSLL